MSRRLKLCSGAAAVKKFKRAGWTTARQAELSVEEFNAF